MTAITLNAETENTARISESDIMPSLGVAAAAGVVAARKNIERKLRRKGATSPETAVKPEEAEITAKHELIWLNRLIEQGNVGRTEDGKIWWKG
jgi:hypothetical protein